MDKTKKSTIDSKEYAQKFFNRAAEYHYNDVPDSRSSQKISTGSLKLDYATDGGIAPGAVYVTGPKEGGKTSFVLSCMKNSLESVENCKGIFIPAERPLTSEMKERSGIKFVRDPKDWEYGTCLIFETNIYEVVLAFIKNLSNRSRHNNEKYFMAIDSSNGLIPKGDMAKSFEDAIKVAGGALLMSDFFRKTCLEISKLGHYLFITGQDRAQIKVNQYVKGDRNHSRSSGGNALPHYATWCLDFQKPTQADYIVEKGKTIGRNVRVKLEKTPNDMTGEVIDYPVLHRRWQGKSIWQEREVVDMCNIWGLVINKGSWLYLDDDLIEFLKGKNLFEEEKYHGVDKFYQYLNNTEGVLPAIFGYIQQFSV